MISALSLKQQAQQIVVDINLLQQFAQPASKNIQSLPNSMSMSALTKMLRNKNARYNFSNQQRQRDQAWVISKRGNIQPLLKRAEEIKRIAILKKQESIRQSKSQFFINPELLKNQNEFIIKKLQYSILTTVQLTLSLNSNINNRTYKKRRIKQLNLQNIVPNNTGNQNQTFDRNKKRVEEYVRAVQHIFIRNQKLDHKNWTATFKAVTKLKLWDILNNFVQYSFKQHQTPTISKMALVSLKMVEAQFNQNLPSNIESIIYHLNINYLRKMQGKYKQEGNRPTWGLLYLLYRSGRKKQFHQQMPDLEISKMFEKVDESIIKQQPIIIEGLRSTDDSFKDQLLYALGGQSKYSSDVLCDPNTLDVSWIFLRNVGIFAFNEQKFRGLQQQICQSYKNSALDQTKVKNLLYLLCFEQLIEYGPNQMINQQDFLHFLIVMYYCQPFKTLLKNKKALVQRKLTERLAQFIDQLIVENRKQFLHYIAIMPEQNLANEISSIVGSRKLIQKIKWSELEKLLPGKIYSDLVCLACVKHAEQHRDYVLAAQKCLQIIGNERLAMDLVVSLFVKSGIQFRVEENQLRRADNLARDIMKENQKISMEYSPVFQLFNQNRSLEKLINQRNQNKLFKFLKQCKHVLISQKIRADTEKAIEKLIQRQKNGFDYYIQYMKNIVNGYQISLTKLGKFHELQQLFRMTLNALVRVCDYSPFSQFAKRDSTISLIKVLEESLYTYR